MPGESLGRVRRRVKNPRRSRRPGRRRACRTRSSTSRRRTRASRDPACAPDRLNHRGIDGEDDAPARSPSSSPSPAPTPDALQEVARREAVHRVAHTRWGWHAPSDRKTRLADFFAAGLPRGLHREHLVRLE